MDVLTLMGPSGAGKSTVGRAVATALNVPFVEGDDHHPAANIAKMRQGTPLTAADRRPWIDQIGSALRALDAPRAALSCSALNEEVRANLCAAAPGTVRFFWLDAPAAVLHARLTARQGHFMKAHMVDSQLASFRAGPDLTRLDATAPLDELVAQIIAS